jgi:hypothetical protein
MYVYVWFIQFLLHNNYIVGEEVKWKRFEAVGLTCWNESRQECRVHRSMLDALIPGTINTATERDGVVLV